MPFWFSHARELSQAVARRGLRLNLPAVHAPVRGGALEETCRWLAGAGDGCGQSDSAHELSLA